MVQFDHPVRISAIKACRYNREIYKNKEAAHRSQIYLIRTATVGESWKLLNTSF